MKKIFLLLALLSTTLTLSAGPIGEARARQIAEEFFSAHATRSAVGGITLSWAGDSIIEPISTGAQLDNALMYIYNRGANDGFIVVAGDSNVDPIVAYSLNSTIDTNNMAEATRDILDAWCKQISAARKEQVQKSIKRSSTTRSGDELLYETALWNQGEPYNREAPVWEGYRCVTGCVATAMSIICLYNRWPECGIGTTPEYGYYDRNNVERIIEANTLGRAYDYDNMLLDYANGYTETEANAVAAIMKDMGTSVQMMYHYTESGTYDSNVVNALTSYFGYSKSAQLTRRDSYYDSEEWNDIVRANLREYGPMYYSGHNGVGGHAFVVSGYNSNDYFYINFGWGGQSNGWYLIPEIEYYLNQQTILGLAPDRDNSSTYVDILYLTSLIDSTTNEVLYRGIQSDATKYESGGIYNFSIGGIYNAGPRLFSGDISVVHCNSNNEWKSVLSTFSYSDLLIGHFIYFDTQYTITESIESGDCICIFSKNIESQEWQLVRRFSEGDVDKIHLAASAEEVAQSLEFSYNKLNGELMLQSSNALQIELQSPTGEVSQSETPSHHTLLYTISEHGEYLFNIRSGGEPYTLKLKL